MMVVQDIKIDDLVPEWALKYNILMGYRGSHVHGTYIDPTEEHGTDDVDLFSVFAHPQSYYLGLGGYHNSRSVYETSGDIDIVGYELRKYIDLLVKGNPNVHSHLWLEPEDYLFVSTAGNLLIDNRDIFISQRLFDSLAGYAYGQLKRMVAFQFQGYMGEKRKQLANRYGYDIKNASHCIRLLYMGIHFADTGRINVKLPKHELDVVLSIKRGEVLSIVEVQARAEQLFKEFRKLEAQNRESFSRSPDLNMVDMLLSECLRMSWDS